MEDTTSSQGSILSTSESNEDSLSCVYCGQRTSGFRDESCLKCEECETFVHFTCLCDNVRIPECVLLGDVFYKFTCKSCSPSGVELVTKEKISWLTVLVLALYNLQDFQHLSRHGYFHWKLHIADFIDRKWNHIFGGSIKRKRAWHGTVSGTLSHYSPAFFQTGTQVLRESGWWKLTHENLSPFNTMCLKHSGSIKPTTVRTTPEVSSFEDYLNPHSSISSSDTCMVSGADRVSPELDADMLSYSDSESLDVDIDIPVDMGKEGFPGMDSELSELFDQFVSTENSYPVSPNNSHNLTKMGDVSASGSYKSEKDSDSDSNDDGLLTPAPKSLFKINPVETERKYFWQDYAHRESTDSKRCRPMTEYEELDLLKRLSKQIRRAETLKGTGQVPSSVYRLHRKLCVRREQRKLGLQLFSDVLMSYLRPKSANKMKQQAGIRHLDRFQTVFLSEESQCWETTQQSFMLRLLGHVEPTPFRSPYTERVLKPYIRRAHNYQALWLQIMAGVQKKVRGVNFEPTQYPLDFSYVQPHHIPAINSLCELFFWPGIDLSESLQYPDFSCVALYRKLVVGFAFLVPDVNYNESYISFLFTRPEWRKAGIANFMLYHLIQTCMGKDITLHVSATNPAVILYQKYGFKVEEMVQDFYDKYFPPNSKECKHALFMRLSR